jgi:calcineurin-like phosphoesterase family protein
MLVEIRIGPGKWKLRNIMGEVGKKCRIRQGKNQDVPHLTLYGPFSADRFQLENIKKSIAFVGNAYSYLPFLIDDFEVKESPKDNSWIFAFKVIPSEDLEKLKYELAKELKKIAPSPQPWDNCEDSWFHISLALNLSKFEANKIWFFLHEKEYSVLNKILYFFGFKKSDKNSKKYFYLPMNGLRITLLNDMRKIICEYDLLQKRWLSRGESLDRYEYKRTLKLFRIKTGIEDYYNEKQIIEESSIYFIGDLHLDHANIINYCARPFSYSDVNEMNTVLTVNWNNKIKTHDIVYFLGDMAFGRDSKPSDYYLKHLNGNIEFIRGSHDLKVRDSKPYEVLDYKNYKFLIIHNPDKIPIKWDNWVIHGHKHNNDLKNYPFINGERKTINVSAELINYKPVSIDFFFL